MAPCAAWYSSSVHVIPPRQAPRAPSARGRGGHTKMAANGGRNADGLHHLCNIVAHISRDDGRGCEPTHQFPPQGSPCDTGRWAPGRRTESLQGSSPQVTGKTDVLRFVPRSRQERTDRTTLESQVPCTGNDTMVWHSCALAAGRGMRHRQRASAIGTQCTRRMATHRPHATLNNLHRATTSQPVWSKLW